MQEQIKKSHNTISPCGTALHDPGSDWPELSATKGGETAKYRDFPDNLKLKCIGFCILKVGLPSAKLG